MLHKSGPSCLSSDENLKLCGQPASVTYQKTREGCGCFWGRKVPGKFGKTAGKNFPESPNATNSRISGTGKGKPAGNLGSTLPGPFPHLLCRVFFEIDSSSLLEFSEPNVKNPLRVQAAIWLKMITSRDAKSPCFNGSRTSRDVIISGVFWAIFWPKKITSRDGCFLLILRGKYHGGFLVVTFLSVISWSVRFNFVTKTSPYPSQ